MRQILIVLVCLLSINTFAGPQKRPNIVIYLADDLGWKDIGVNGAKVVKTPNIDILASEGMYFNNAFIASPACAPSRAAMLTGLMPARNGAEENHTYPSEGIEVLTKRLQNEGYKVFSFGKVAHGKMANECDFDFVNDKKVNLLNHVREFFETTKVDGPVCLMVGDRRPHVQWTKDAIYKSKEVDLPPYFIDTKETREHRARYYTDVTGFDATMGEVLAFADSLLGKNTIVMMSSDHGAQWPFGKWNLYDASIRTPLIVKWPDKIEAGSKTNAMVSWVDLFPTLLDLAGATVPENLDGKSFASVLKGDAISFRDTIYTTHSGDGIYNVYPIRSVRTNRYKYIRNLRPDCYHTNHSDLLRKDGAGAYWDSWDEAAENDQQAAQIIKKYYQRPAEEFYDLVNDPDEQNNLIQDTKYKKEIKKMSKTLDDWMVVQGDQLTIFRQPYPLSEPKPNKLLIEKLIIQIK